MNIIEGDIFTAKTEAIVNPVNCIGVMGAGLALQFKNRYPDVYNAYREACINGQVKIGKVWTYTLPQGHIIHFPTKNDWRDHSRKAWIEEGLVAFKSELERLNCKSVAVPLLGAGKGRLSRDVVLELLETHLDGIETRVDVYVPKGN